ncbi:hypothetical protein [Duganella violaceipulchra]|uniref:Uncharacterized protein n=1 Tax=Duganella violaceipulchra TaxID=2849652 RepID=A0AA41L7I6_9BURK|nr:hypothetical protein [Duganella violaceicalia]MBV6324372.1 hypothetical protein [Duganella violaceicalia]MCP2007234.1 hypothetical protein [Duganella violaceicalia]
MLKKMLAALASMTVTQKTFAPKALSEALLDFGSEIDRLRADFDELRLKLENKK